jgi:hypothetical protein
LSAAKEHFSSAKEVEAKVEATCTTQVTPLYKPMMCTPSTLQLHIEPVADVPGNVVGHVAAFPSIIAVLLEGLDPKDYTDP